MKCGLISSEEICVANLPLSTFNPAAHSDPLLMITSHPTSLYHPILRDRLRHDVVIRNHPNSMTVILYKPCDAETLLR